MRRFWAWLRSPLLVTSRFHVAGWTIIIAWNGPRYCWRWIRNVNRYHLPPLVAFRPITEYRLEHDSFERYVALGPIIGYKEITEETVIG